MTDHQQRRRCSGALVAAVAAVGALAPIALAAPAGALSTACSGGNSSSTVTWTGAGDGNYWNDAANWDLDCVPGAGNPVILPAGTGLPVSVSDSESAASVQVGDSSNNPQPSLVLLASTGQLSVSGGVVSYGGVVLGNGSGLTATVTLNAGSLLEGAGGTVTGDVNNDAGQINVFDQSAGVLTILGNYSQGADGKFLTHINSTVAGGSFGQMQVSEDISLGGTVITDAGSISFTPVIGDVYPIIEETSNGNGSVGGSFTKLESQTYTPNGSSTTYGFIPHYASSTVGEQVVGPPLFQQSFEQPTVSGVVVPAAPDVAGQANFACLTAGPVPDGATSSVPNCSLGQGADAPGSGALRLTDANGGEEGGVFSTSSFPTVDGLDVTFDSYQYGGGGADGIAFALAAADPANPAPPAFIGNPGGALGYSPGGEVTDGLDNGYLAVGLDAWGNFSQTDADGTGCTPPAWEPNNTTTPAQVTIRGPGSGTAGYCAVNSTLNTQTPTQYNLRADRTLAPPQTVPVEVAINPGSSGLSTPSGLFVPATGYAVMFTAIGRESPTILTGPLPSASGVYPRSTDSDPWVNPQTGLPYQLTFGWVGSTGAVTDIHEINNVNVQTLNGSPPLLSLTNTDSFGGKLPAGSAAAWTLQAGVLPGTAEGQPLTLTDTLPAGVAPQSAAGTGWTCGAFQGQTVTCTYPVGGGIPPGTSLPAVTLSGTVSQALPIGTGLDNMAVLSSSDAVPASATDFGQVVAPLPSGGASLPRPTVTGVSPSTGPAGGGTPVTITGTGFITDNTSFSFGNGNLATDVSCATLTSCTAVTPPGAGTVDVIATVFGATSPVNPPADQFTYAAPPPPSSGGSGSGGSGGTSTVSGPGSCPAGNQRFVCQAYTDLLNRMPESFGLAAWTAALNRGMSRTEVAQGIEGSLEHEADLVAGWYQTYLHRTPSPSDQGAWANLLAHGVTDEVVQASLLGSPEYFAHRGGSTDSGFLAALYQDVLGRPIDSGGQAFWSAALSHGLTRTDVALALLSSAEGRQVMVVHWYQEFLRRSVTAPDAAAWVTLMGLGATDEMVVASLVGSPEYFSHFAS